MIYRRTFTVLLLTVSLFFLSSTSLIRSAPGIVTEQDLLPVWNFYGEITGCEFGQTVSYAGDVNNDHFSDILVGSPKASSNNTDLRDGAGYLFFGTGNGFDQTFPVRFGNLAQGSYFGSAITVGDVNCDGDDDLIFGAPQYKPADLLPDAGAVYIYYGPISTYTLTPTLGLSIYGEQRDIFYGKALSAGGDLNGDGCDDLAVGAPRFAVDELNIGRVYVYYGTAAAPLTSTVQTIDGSQSGALFGNALSIKGSINGDVYADLIVGAPRYDEAFKDNGAVFLYQGSSIGVSALPNWQAYGAGEEAVFGSSIDTTGDLNGDGIADLAVGSPLYDYNFVNEGRVDVFFGSSTELSSNSQWRALGWMKNAKFGTSLSTGGDLNADGYSDLAVGAPFALTTTSGSSQNEPEAVYFYLGSQYGLHSGYTWVLWSGQSTTDFGTSVAIVPDHPIDANEYDYVLIGAPSYFRDEKTKLGEAMVYIGAESTGDPVMWLDIAIPYMIKE